MLFYSNNNQVHNILNKIKKICIRGESGGKNEVPLHDGSPWAVLTHPFHSILLNYFYNNYLA
jgi:hypothetical protein